MSSAQRDPGAGSPPPPGEAGGEWAGAPGAEAQLRLAGDGRVLDARGAVPAVLGHPPEALAGLAVSALVHLEDAPRLAAAADRAAGRPGVVERVLVRALRDGEEAWVEADVVARAGTLFCAMRPADDRVRAEAALAEARAAMEALGTGVLIVDATGCVRLANPAACRLLGRPAGDLVGTGAGAIPLEDADGRPLAAAAHPLERARREGATPRLELALRLPGGGLRWVAGSAQALPATGGAAWTFADAGPDREARARRAVELERLAGSEARFRAVADDSPALMWLTDASGRLTFFNRTCLEFRGRTMEQELDGWADGVHPDDAGRLMPEYARAVAEQRPFAFVLRLRRHDGAWRWMEDRGAVRRDAEGRFAGFAGVSVDITERLEAEAAGRESATCLRAALDALAEGLLVLGEDGRVVQANPAAARILGAPAGRLPVTGWLDGDGRPLEADRLPFRRTLAGEGAVRAERLGVRRPDGGLAWVEVSTEPLAGAGAGVRGVVVTLVDVTARLAAARALAASEAGFRALAESSRDLIVRLTPEGVFRYASPAAREVLGLAPEELIGRRSADLVVEADRPLLPSVGGAREGEDHRTITVRARRRDGRVVWLESAVRFLRGTAGELVEIRGSARDVSDRVEHERALRAGEERFRLLAENASDIVIRARPDGTLLWLSPSVEHLLGHRPAQSVGHLLADWVHPADRPLAGPPAREGVHDVRLLRMRHADGSWRWVECSFAMVRGHDGGEAEMQCVAREVTERVEAERAAARRQQILAAAAHAATRLLGEGATAEVVADVLARLGTATGADRVSLLERIDPAASRVRVRAEWRAPGTPGAPVAAAVDLGESSDVADWLARGAAVGGPLRTLRLGPAVRAVLHHLGVQSLAVVPVVVAGEWTGVLSLEDLSAPRAWSEGDLDAIRTVAEALGAADGRRRSAERFRQAAEASPDPVSIWAPVRDAAGALVDLVAEEVNAEALRVTGLTRDRFVGGRMRELFGPVAQATPLLDDCAAALRAGAPVEREVVAVEGGPQAGLELWYRILPLPGGVAITVKDVNAARAQERAATESERRYRLLADALPDITARVDRDGRYVYANPALERATGIPVAAWIGRTDAEAGLPPEQCAALEAMRREAVDTGRPVLRDLVFDGAAGRRHLAATMVPERDGAGEVGHVVVVVRDVTAERLHAAEEAAVGRVSRAVAAARRAEEVFEAVCREASGLFQAAASAVVRFADGDGLMVAAHAAGRRAGLAAGGPAVDLAGPSAVAQVARTGAEARTGPEAAGAPGAVERALAAGATAAIAAPIHVEGRLWGALTVVLEGGGFPPGADERLARFSELAGLAVANAGHLARLAAMARTDPLTGLPNHLAFQERLAEEALRAARHHRSLALAVLDLDGFREVNDEHGHWAGDEVVKAVGALLAAMARPGDVVARIGGDEFAWLLPEATADAARAAAERARLAIRGARLVRGARVRGSFGVADLDLAAGSAPALSELADGALWWAKASGRDRVVVYSPAVVAQMTAATGEELERHRALAAVQALARAVDAKDHATREHSERVAALAGAIAEALGWDPLMAGALREAALVHDVGKVGVPDRVVLARHDLTAGELAELARHPGIGAEIVGEILSGDQTAWVRHHHERWDGTGYPDGLAGAQIPRGARIIAVANAFDGLTAARPPAGRRSRDAALAEIEAAAGVRYWPEAVRALADLVFAGHPATMAGG